MSRTLVPTGSLACIPVLESFWRKSSKRNWSYTSLKSSLNFSIAQHGFIEDRSIIINILLCDALIADFESRKAACDVIAFDF